ncbi:carbohydrate sulfotransferase 14-like [Branchiostoma lanceolatum]|uniref:carbohydrate sulfotransferase 14-like n=1 Tax=Branchiostoma lanceolatum TaxID=7740 RepID=UPI003451DBFC
MLWGRRSSRFLLGLGGLAMLSMLMTWIVLGRTPQARRGRLVPAWDRGTSAPRPAERAEAPAESQDFKVQRDIQNYTIQSVCSREGMPRSPYNLETWEQKTLFRHIIVNDKYKFLYCYIPKVACSNWKKVIKVLDGKIENVEKRVKMDHRKDLVFLSDLPADEVKSRLESYYKFMFVRDPMQRLLSAYRDKFANKAIVDFPLRYGRDIIRKYRANAPTNVNGTDMTFSEFVHYLSDTEPREMNEHWQPFTKLCQPCPIQYDFIGTQENLEADANHVLRAVGAPPSVRFPQRQAYYKPTNKNILRQYLSEVPPQLLKDLIPKYSMDFMMFAYPIPELDTI